MRRDEIKKSIRRILDDLSEIDLVPTLGRILSGEGRERDPSSLLSVFQRYSIMVSGYSKEEIEIIGIMGIDILSDPKLWSALITDPSGVAHDIDRRLNFTIENLPRLLRIFEQDYARDRKAAGGRPPEDFNGRERLTIILAEDAGEYSSPERIVSALAGVSKMYIGIAETHRLDGDGLVVLGCDSGSDKSFDLLGIAQVMHELRDTIIAIWDRRVFYRHQQMSASIELISQSLPVLAEVEELRRTGAILPEQAEIIRRKLVEGATMFLESGSIIPDMETEGALNPRVVMRAEQMLLSGPSAPDRVSFDSDADNTETPDDDEEEISPDERRQLRGLLRSASADAGNGRSKGKRPPRSR